MIKFIFFIMIGFVICSWFAFSQEKDIDISNEVCICKECCKSNINEFIRTFEKKLEKEFHLRKTEGCYQDGFFRENVAFYAHRRATHEEARALALLVLNRLDEEIQADPSLISSFKALSLSPKSIGCRIDFVIQDNWHYCDGSIDNVHVYCSKSKKNEYQRYLCYRITDPFSDYSHHDDETFETDFEESLEEAIKLNSALSTVNPIIHESKGFEDELDLILTAFKKEMKRKYGLNFHSCGWMRSGKPTSDIPEIRAKCVYGYPVDYEKAKELMLTATERLLAIINNSKTLRPYLKEYPFSANRLKLRMLFRKEKFFTGSVPYGDGSMESAVLSGNEIVYYIPNIEGSIRERIIFAKESYEESQRIFENTPSLLRKACHNFSKLIIDLINIFSYLIFYLAFGVLFVLCNFFFEILAIIALIIILVLLLRWRKRRRKKVLLGK